VTVKELPRQKLTTSHCFEYVDILNAFLGKNVFFAGIRKKNFRRSAGKTQDPTEMTRFPSVRFGTTENCFLCRAEVSVVPGQNLPKTLPSGI
jgi:hypothetical protein